MAKRTYSILRKQLAENQRNFTSDRRNDAELPSIDKSMLDDIFTVDADPSLSVLPPVVRRQVEEYLETPGATTKAFALSNQSFDLRLTTRKEPAIFVELGTTKVLDCGIYEFGICKRSRIVVVNPRPGSTFNNGDPGIITFYGKGLKVDRVSRGRNIISRWAIWTPQGIKDDILVERLVTGAPLDDSDDSDVIRPARKERRIVRKKTNQNDRQQSEGLFVTPQPEEGHSAATDQNKNGQNWVTFHKDGGGVVKEESGAGDTDLTASRPDDRLLSRSMSMMISRPAFPQPSRAQYDHGSTNTSDPLGHLNLSSPIVPASNNRPLKGTVFAFQAHHNAVVQVEKAAAQCNSVHKLFAYAYKAGLLRDNNVMLSASFGNQVYQVIRDDESDFTELLQRVHDMRIASSEDAITVVVTPSTY